MTLRVRNDGDAFADGVVVRVAGNTSVSEWDMGGFRDGGAGYGEFLSPGEEKSVSFTFEVPSVLSPVIEFTAASSVADVDPVDDRFVLAVPVARGSVDGVLYGDRDLDSVVDPGEGLSGVELKLRHRVAPFDEIVVRTREGGRFAMPEVPVGEYYMLMGLPPGWKFDGAPAEPYLQVAAGENVPKLRAVRIVKPALDASVRFDRTTYAVGDVIREHVRLTNTGTTDLVGVTALCTGMGNPNELGSPGWGDLSAYTGAGITVPRGKTLDFEFTDVVPQGGWEYGHIQINCWFAADTDYLSGVMAGDEATVPGGYGDTSGTLHLDLDDNGYQKGEGLPGVKVYLVNSAGRIAARAVTGADGLFRFVKVPAANYEVRFVGPWRYIDHSAEYIQVVAGQSRDGAQFRVLPGPNQPDPDAPPPPAGDDDPSTSDGSPAPQARANVPDNLADTGASVRELVGIGIGLLLVGMWLLFLPMRARRES